MAEGKKSFLLYCDLIHTVRKMPDEKAGQLLKHILEYVNDTNPETEDLLLQLVFEPIKQQLKRDLNKWNNISITRSEIGRLAGIKSGEARRNKANQNEPIGLKTNQNEHVSDSVNDTVNVNETVIEKLEKRKIAFGYSLKEFESSYSKEMLTAFFRYWTEKNKSGTKMKWELEKTFEVSLRLINWASRDKTFQTAQQTTPIKREFRK
jgi:hypothetical protein